MHRSQEALTGEEKAEQQLSKSFPPHVLSGGQHFLLRQYIAEYF